MLRNVRILGVEQMLQTRLRAEIRPAHVDCVHQVEPLHRRIERPRQKDRAGVVDEDIDAAKCLDRLCHSGSDLLLKPNIAHTRQRLPTGGFNLLTSAEYRSRQLWMRSVGLPNNGYVCAVPRSPQRDCLANSATGAGDEQRHAGKRVVHRMSLSLLVRPSAKHDLLSRFNPPVYPQLNGNQIEPHVHRKLVLLEHHHADLLARQRLVNFDRHPG